MSNLPDSWVETTVEAVTLPFESRDPAHSPTETFRYIDIGSIDNSRQIIAMPKTLLGREAPSRARRVVKAGDVLFSTVRTYLKNIAQVPSELDGAFTSTGVAVLRPSGAIDPRYLLHWVCSAPFIEAMSKAQDGTMYPAVTDRDVGLGAVPLPPIAEQRRIVAKLDALTARTAQARADLDRIPALTARYRQAVLTAAFTDWIDQFGSSTFRSDKASIKTVGELIDNIVGGKNLRCEERPPHTGELGVVKVSAVTWGRFNPKAAKTLPPDFCPPPHTKIESGDLLLSRANTLELVGAAVIVNETPNNLYLSDKVLRIEMSDDYKLWLMWYLRSPMGRADIEGGSSGNQLSMRNLSQDALRRIRLPFPNDAVRAEILRRLEAAIAEIDRLAAEAAAARRLLDHLDQAVLAKAFRGELVPQNPTDEPASALLERIKAQRAVTLAARRGRKPR